MREAEEQMLPVTERQNESEGYIEPTRSNETAPERGLDTGK